MLDGSKCQEDTRVRYSKGDQEHIPWGKGMREGHYIKLGGSL